MSHDDLCALEQTIGYTFNNKELLRRALTHKTFAFEAKQPLEFNERLEFLGDSILSFIIAEQLYVSNKYFSEGELTRRRANTVNNDFLADKANELALGTYLILGKGEKKQNGAANRTNLANALEAIIGAIYLDSDLPTVKNFLLNKIFSTHVLF